MDKHLLCISTWPGADEHVNQEQAITPSSGFLLVGPSLPSGPEDPPSFSYTGILGSLGLCPLSFSLCQPSTGNIFT